MFSSFRQILGWLSFSLVAIGVVLATVSPTLAGDKPSFDELLTRAQSQAALGHRCRRPPGNNMTETIAAMVDMIPTATPEQLRRSRHCCKAMRRGLRRQGGRRSRRPIARRSQSHPRPSHQTEPRRTRTHVRRSRTRVRRTRRCVRRVGHDGEAAAPSAAGWADCREFAIARGGTLARGQEAERQGDVSGARRLYAAAAEQGSATAARSLGRLYDPVYLKQTALEGIDPIPASRATGMNWRSPWATIRPRPFCKLWPEVTPRGDNASA